MRKVIIPSALWVHIAEIRAYLTDELKLSEIATERRIGRIEERIISLGGEADYALCRYRRWRILGYHCMSFEGWIFAYEIFDEGVIIRDMAHGKMLDDVAIDDIP